ncbi:MAG: FAD:protein FMN transferase [Nannocystaceae bacterium]
MGTRFTINLWLGPRSGAVAAGDAVRAAFHEVARLEAIASEWQPDSDISRLNRAAGGEPIVVAPDLIDLLNRSRTISEATAGAFDISFYAVGALWNFDPGSRPPSAEAIREQLMLVDWRLIHVDAARGRARLTRSGMRIGLGAIAKGYAVDRASHLLRARGFPDHIVEGGGDTYVAGTKGDQSWRVGIKDPAGHGTLAALPVHNMAVVTSGTYERYFEYEGTQYTHILDPSTGWPIKRASSPLSVSAIATNATDADAFATAISVMGTEAGLRFVETKPGLDVVIVDTRGKLRFSAGLKDKLEVHASADATP